MTLEEKKKMFEWLEDFLEIHGDGSPEYHRARHYVNGEIITISKQIRKGETK